MVLKLLVFMVALAVLEGIAGLQEEQFANETQIEANPDHKKRGRRLDKLPCITEQGTCQRIGVPCDGVVGEGPEWCLHHRHFECCYPKHCVLNGAVCPNGTVAVQSCIELICNNGCWVNQGISPLCCPCHAYGATTIKRYEETPEISMNGRGGVYHFSWYRGPPIKPDFGIDIVFDKPGGTCITFASYTENAVTVNIWFNSGNPDSPEVTVGTDYYANPEPFSRSYSHKAHQLPGFIPPVYLVCDAGAIYIIGNDGISLLVTWDPANPKCAENVYSYAAPSVWGHLNGLCKNITNNCEPRHVTVSPNTDASIEDWKVNPDDTKRGRGLDKLPCFTQGGTCISIAERCYGEVKQGPEWCLHHRYFECCIFKDCELNGKVYPNGAVSVQSCIELKCENGCWKYDGWSPHCCACYTYGNTTIEPYDVRPYSFSGYQGVYSFSQYTLFIPPPCGIEIVQFGDCITGASYFESGRRVNIYFNNRFPDFPTMYVTDFAGNVEPVYFPNCNLATHPLPLFSPPVYYICDGISIYIIGNCHLSMYVTWNPANQWCAQNVWSIANAGPLRGDLYGLCDNGCDYLPHDGNYTMSNGEVTDDLEAFIHSYEHPRGRSQRNKLGKIPSSANTRQVTGQPIISRSMSEIEKSCEEMNKGPCTIIPSEECEKVKEDCVSNTRDESKPGQGSFSDSTE